MLKDFTQAAPAAQPRYPKRLILVLRRLDREAIQAREYQRVIAEMRKAEEAVETWWPEGW